MSKTTIDEKVVELRFNNKDFERNTRETMSTLDKLKEKLNFTGASKGLENLNATANKTNMNGLSNALDTVHSKFSVMEVVGITALANITNSAVEAGKRMIKALTIDPVMAGMSEYETKMGSIQTILANTEHQGTTLDDVTAALDELNTYADKTIYNFQEMTRNIGTFTAAGVDLRTSVQSIKGIANLAAVSGSTSQQASVAMYQLSQALSSGTVRLQDWNSVVNAGMGGKVFQNALIRTAAMLDGQAKNVEKWQAEHVDAYGSFRDSLTQGAWLTTDVLTETLRQFTMSAKEGSEEWAAFKAELKEIGYTDAQANEILKMANTATDAATKVKTFTQLFDTLKESAQSGWAQTWEIIFGDFEEAKEFFTGLSDMIGGIINGMSEFRNSMLGSAMDSNWDIFVSKLNNAGIQTTEYEESLRKVLEAYGLSAEELDEMIEYYGSLSKVIKAGEIPADILKEALEELGVSTDGTTTKIAGFVEGLKSINRMLRRGNTGKDVKKLQTALHELGYDLGKPGIDGIIGPITERAIKQFQKEAGLVVDGIAGPKTLAALKEAGKSIEKTADEVSDMDVTYGDLLDNITQKGGRELFLEAFSNIVNAVTGALKALGQAWAFIFPPENAARGLLGMLEKFHAFTESLRLMDEVVDENGDKMYVLNENGEKLANTFGGIFAILKIVTSILSFPLKIAFEVLSRVLEHFNLPLLDITSAIGVVLMRIEEFLFQDNLLIDILTTVAIGLVNAAKAVGRFAKELWNLPEVQNFFKPIIEFIKSLKSLSIEDIGNAFKKLGEGIVKAFSGINDKFYGVPGDIISGLANGLKDGIVKVVKAIINLANIVIDKFEEILGIASPSKVFFAIGGFIIAGLIGGLLNGIPGVNTTLEEITGNITGFFGSIEWNKIFAGIMSGGLMLIVKRMVDIVGNFSSVARGLGDLMSGTGEVLDKSATGIKKILKSVANTINRFGKAFAKVMKQVGKSFAKLLSAKAFKERMEGIKEFAIAVVLLAGSLYLVSKIQPDRLWESVGALLALAGVMTIMALAVNEIEDAGSSLSFSKDKGFNFKTSGLQTLLLSIGATILLLGTVVKMLGKLSKDQIEQGFLYFAGVVSALAIVIYVLSSIDTKSATNMVMAGECISKIAKAILILAVVCKLMSLLTPEDMIKGGFFLVGFLVFVYLLAEILKIDNKYSLADIGSVLLKISSALLILAIVAKIAGKMSLGELGKAGLFMAGFLVFLKFLVEILKVGKKDQIAKVGGVLLGVSGSLLLLVIVAKLIGLLGFWDCVKAIAFMGGFLIFLKYLVKTLTIGKKDQIAKVAGTMLALSVAIGILAAVAIILSLISLPGLAKGVIAIGLLGYIVTEMVKATSKVSKNAKQTVMMLAIAIGVMAAAVALLSFIDPAKLAIATGALASLMGTFALMQTKAKNTTKAIPTLLVLTGIIVLLAIVIKQLTKLPVNNVLDVSLSLSSLLISMAVVLKILSTIGPLASASYPAMKALAVFITGLLVFLGLIGALVTFVPSIKGFLSTGIDIMVMLADGLGRMIGAFVKGALTKISEALPIIGENLTKFMQKVMPFMSSAQIIGSNAKLILAGVGVITAAILALTAATFLQAIASFLTLGQASFAMLGVNLSKFALAATPFFIIMSTVDPAILHGVKALAEAILLITAADLLDGIKLFGQSSLEKFGSEMAHLGTGVKGFIEALGVVTQTEVDTAVHAANIIKVIAEAATKIPNSGGLLAGIVGENNMEDWARQLLGVARGIAAFVITCRQNNISKADVTTAENAASIITKLAEASNKIPNTGGALAALVGDNKLGDFANEFPNVGKGIAGFVDEMNKKSIKKEAVGVAETAAKVVSALADASQKVDNTGGLLAKLVGDKDLGTFATQFPNIGKGVAGFATALSTGGFTTEHVPVVNAAVSVIQAITGLGNIVLKPLTKNLPKLGEKLVDFGTDIADFVTKIEEATVSSINSAVNATMQIIAMAQQAANIPVKNLDTFTSSLVKFAEDGIQGYVGAFTNQDSVKDVMDGATALVDAALMPLTSFTLKFKLYSAGLMFAEGFAKGITAGDYKVKAAARNLGTAAEDSLNSSIVVASPSKVAFKSGGFFGLGFVNGIKNTMSKVYDASSEIGDKAKTGLSKAISKVSDLINSDIDANPTIRPVLDLSDVENGASLLNSMFNDGPSIGVMSNLNAIGRGFNNNNQNGRNDDVVSAINKLRNDLGNVGGNTYNVNGVTYDDGTNITTAVKDLIRAIQIEGRM